MQSSAAIRYAVGDDWLLIKGEGTKTTPPSVQFPLLATRLVYGSLKSHYSGPEHCDGCLSAKACANGSSGLGSAGVWRRICGIHHITTAVEALQALPWP
jgi:hypothetical protein